VLGGLGSLVEAGSPDHARHVLDRFVEEADDLGTDRGVDRIRLTGDTYTAGCGASRPHLDHASRVAAFALEVLDTVEDLDGDERITVAVGVDSGPLTVGLTGGSRLVHDTWGVTVQRATDLARRARPGEILASSAVRSQLPSNFALSDVGDDDLVRVDGLVSESQATT
jgi:class 3 adenylate cyclase